MADAVISLVLSRTVAPMMRHFSYLCCFNSNIESLRVEATKLARARARVLAESQMNADWNIPEEVETWLENADTLIQADIANVGNGCLNMKSRYTLSRKARNSAEAMEGLRASTEEILRRGAPIGLYSRKEMEEAIMEDLRGGDRVHTIGIPGKMGMGKTTMAKNIMNRAREEKLFNEVMMVRQVHIARIQSEISELLGLRLREESLSARAHKLHAQLTKWPMRILLILDVIRQVLKLEDILGVPCSMFFTIVLTSENENVLREMNAKLHVIEGLSEAEALFLFKEKFGMTWWTDDSDLLSLAKEFVKECKGLPLALTIVGTTLNNEIRKHIWEDALGQLKTYDPLDQNDEVYNPIRLSYNHFLDEDTKSLFLLCCLFPQGYDIHVEYLTLYGIGLHLFAGATSVEDARNRARTAFKTLKAHTLLLDGRDENHVRMHDAVRNAAMFLAAREGRVVDSLSSGGECINCEWISVHEDEMNKLPARSSFPNLRLLDIDNYSKEIEISTDYPGFFQGMIELNVLALRSISFRSLPETTRLLKNLKTLYLDGCTLLETIYNVGELLNLEILICRSCDMIVELPVEIGRLEKLRMLEVYKCRRLERIERGVISNLVRLEELMIIKSFNKWETDSIGEQSRGNAAISEIEYLENLSRLEIEIEDSTVAAEMMFLDEGKVRYEVRFGGSRWEICEIEHLENLSRYDGARLGFARWIKIIVDYMVLLQHGVSMNYLWRNGRNLLDLVEAIEIYDSSTGRLFGSLSVYYLGKLKELRISKCKNIVKVIEHDDLITSCNLFPSLHSLYLEDLPELESFGWSSEGNLASLENVWIKGCHRLKFFTMQNVQLSSLKKIVLIDCNHIESLFSASVALTLQNLRTLSISRCKEMVLVIKNDDTPIHILFPSLEELEFRDLPKLHGFSNSKYDLELSLLENVCIYSCPLWKKFSMGSVSTPKLKRADLNSKVNDTGGTLEW